MEEDTPWYATLLPILLSLGLLVAIVIILLSHFTYTQLLITLKSLRAKEKERRLAIFLKSKKKVTSQKETKKSSKEGEKKFKKGKKKSKKDKEVSHEFDASCPGCIPDLKDKTKMDPKEAKGSLDLRSLVKKLAPFLENFANHPEQFKVCHNVVPGFIYNALPSHAPEEACSIEQLWTDFSQIVWPGLFFWQHPRFFGYFPCGRATPDTLAEMLVAGLGVPAGEWSGCPPLAELEVAMINWTGRALGLPEEMLFQGNTETSNGGGCVTESASESIFLAVMAARTKKIDEKLKMDREVALDQHFLFAPKTKKRLDRHHSVAATLVIYSNREAHSSIEKACRMGLVKFRALKGDPDADHGLTGKCLEEAVEEDIKEGRVPCLVHVTLGTTSSCAFDRLPEIGPIARKYGIWVHVDSAYAGAMWIEPSRRSSQEGIEWVDSIDINLHKMLLHSNSMSLLWTRKQKDFRAAFATRNPNVPSVPGYNACEWGLHNSKRLKALKMWLMFRMMGTDGLKEYINRTCDMAKYLRQMMIGHPNIRMFGELKPAVFSFQYVESGLSEEEINYHTDRLRLYLNESGQLFVTNSSVQGKTIMRLSIGYEKVCKDDVDSAWEALKKLIETYRERKDDPTLVKFPPSPPKK